MRLEIISIHHKMPDWVQHASQHWQKQMQLKINLRTLKPSNLEQATQRKLAEATLLEDELSKLKLQTNAKNNANQVLLLDEHGKNHSSIEFAGLLQKWQLEYDLICLIIGGADGLDERIKQKYPLHFSLSRLTFSHPLAHLVLFEQLYRAEKILQGHPYHRA